MYPLDAGDQRYICDTSAIIEGAVTDLVSRNALSGSLFIHLLLIKYFRRLASKGSVKGFIGLRELERLNKLLKDKTERIKLVYISELPPHLRDTTQDDIDFAICEIARAWGATLITSDIISRETAEALGVPVIYHKVKNRGKMMLESFFDDETMSIHLKEGAIPYAKKGRPGDWRFVPLRKTPMRKEELEILIDEILNACREEREAYIDIEREYSTIVQLGQYRIIITRPPFSDGIEITAVKPLVRLQLEDYKLPPKLIERLEKRAEGILIAGAPGMGKSTFAQALAEFYMRKGRIVKTIESPRDLQLPPEITQYSKSKAALGELHDILLLSRPDYTVFDEMRTTEDFKLYVDLRLAGVGMIGVVHATSPIDAIQRFIGRVELGMIPSIIDTVIFIENGNVSKVYELDLVVKIPYGLKEEDLARPVVIVRDFLTGEPEYEIYVFGERTFVVPIRKRKVAEEKIKRVIDRVLGKYVPTSVYLVEMVGEDKILIRIPPEYIPLLTGKCRKKLTRISRRLGVEIEVSPLT